RVKAHLIGQDALFERLFDHGMIVDDWPLHLIRQAESHATPHSKRRTCALRLPGMAYCRKAMARTQHFHTTPDDIRIGEKVFIAPRPDSTVTMRVTKGVVVAINCLKPEKVSSMMAIMWDTGTSGIRACLHRSSTHCGSRFFGSVSTTPSL